VGATQAAQMQQALLDASDRGKLPIVCDTSPCLQRMKEKFDDPLLKLALFEPVQFILLYLKSELEFAKVRDSIAVHVPCSSKKLKVGEQMVQLAELCATEVHATPIPCCGMAGDRGMRYPELTSSSLQHLDGMMQKHACSDGYSTSRTCEMSLSNHSGVHFRSLLYLLDEAATPKAAPITARNGL
jgi:D-lactate dehydrogenase